MKSKLSMKILGVVVTFATIASLLVGITAAPVSAAAPGALAWTTTDTPSHVNNVLGGVNYTWPGGVLTKTTIGNPDVNLMAASPDGKTIFAWDDANKALYKSADGINWGTSVGLNTTAAAVGLKVSPNFATDNAVALATSNEVFLSTDGGATFTMVASPIGNPIMCFDLGYWYTTGNVLTVLAGFGNGVAYLKWVAGSAWTGVPDAATAPGTDGTAGHPVYAVKFSNNALTDGEIMAVYYDGANLRLSSCFGNLGWGIPAYPDKTIYAAGAAPTTATIALASDYVGNTGASIIIGVNGAGGTLDGIYRVYGRASIAGSVTANLLNQPIASLAVSGPIATATVYAGVVGSSLVEKSANITASTVTFATAPVTGTSAMLALAGAIVYAGTSGADSAVSVSADAGVSFQQVGLIDVGTLTVPGTGNLKVALVNFTAVDTNTMFVVMSNSATNEQFVFKTTNAGVSWARVYTSLVPSGTFNFNLLGQSLPLTAGIGRINLAFDSKFSENKIIYAATDATVTATGKERIFRFTIGKSTGWQSIYASLPNNAAINQLVITKDGTLYAVNTQATVAADKKGGVIRCLYPTYSSPTMETMLSGLSDTVILNKLSAFGNRLWTVDTKNTRLMTFVDSLSVQVSLVSPDNKASGLDTTNLSLKWQAISGATGYEWQVSDSTGFTGLLTGLTGTTESNSVRPSGLEPASTYYWRIRANKPFLSRWSDTWSFNTVLGGSNITPSLSVPAAGAKTAVKPIFQWSTITWADKYDLLVAKDNTFNEVVIDRTGDNALSSNAWESEISLEYNTTYYWKVKARSDTSVGMWSAVSAFTTESATLPTATMEKSPTTVTTYKSLPTTDPTPQQVSTVLVNSADTPQPVNVNINISPWVIYGAGALLLAIVITLTALAVISIRRRH